MFSNIATKNGRNAGQTALIALCLLTAVTSNLGCGQHPGSVPVASAAASVPTEAAAGNQDTINTIQSLPASSRQAYVSSHTREVMQIMRTGSTSEKQAYMLAMQQRQ